MKKILVIIISLFLMPIIVNAETLTFNVCNTCEYTNLDSLGNTINSFDDLSDTNIVINIDGAVSGSYFGMQNISSLTINGDNEATINVERITIMNFKKLIIDNVTINEENESYFFGAGSAYNQNYLRTRDNIIELKNSTFSGEFAFSNSQITVEYCTLSTIFFGESDVFVNNSNIEIANIFSGINYMGNTNVHLYSSNQYNDIIRVNYTDEVINSITEAEGQRLQNSTAILEYPANTVDDNYNYITAQNKLYFYQDTDKEVKVETDISVFEPEFKNTYENSVGYDDIKDLPIEWKSENESIATLDNGTIKPIANGQVDLVGTRGNDIYTIHLTVDMPAKKTNEKKGRMAPSTKITLNSVFKDLDISSISDDVWEISNPKVAKIVNGEIISLAKGETDIVATINGVKYIYHLTVGDTLVSKEIKVPITGKNIKLWIVIVSILLLSVIGTCTFMLLKSKKAE